MAADPIPFPKKHVPPLVLIDEERVSIDRLKQVLDSAFIDAEIEPEGDLYISQGLDFPIWVSLDLERKLVNPYTCIGIRQSNNETAFRQANELNKRLIVAKFHIHDGALWANTWLTFDGGLSARQFVMSLRQFATIFQQATNESCAASFFNAESTAEADRSI